MFENESRDRSALSMCDSNRKRDILLKRMSTWIRSYGRAYIPLYFSLNM